MLKIALDFDNCILDSPSTIINLHNKLNENKIEYNTNMDIDWKFYPVIKTEEELAELFKLFDHKDFYKDTIVFNNAIEVINELSKRHKVIIISKHMEARKPLTRKWIQDNLPNVEVIFTDTFEDKGKMLKGFDVILDDRIDSLQGCEGIVKHLVCFSTYDWNKDYSGLRVNNWLEFKQFIDKLEKLDN